MKEIKFTPCYVAFEGKNFKCGLTSYDDGRSVLLYSASGVFGPGNAVEELRNAGCNLHSMSTAVWLPGFGAAGVSTKYPGAVVHLPGSVEFEECEQNKTRRPGGRNNTGAAAPAAPNSEPVPAADHAQDSEISCRETVAGALETSNFGAVSQMVVTAVVPGVDAYAVALLDTVTVDNVPGVDCSAAVSDGLNAGGLAPMAALVAGVIVAPLNSWLAGLVSEKVENLKNAAPAVPAAPVGVWSVVNLPGKYQVTAPDGTVKEFEGVAPGCLVKTLNKVYRDNVTCGVLTVGPAGCGKSMLAKTVAAVLGLEFYQISPEPTKYDLAGFVDAGGRYVESALYQAMKNGGVLLVDEFDLFPAAVVKSVFNAVLEQREYNFPGVGLVHAHKDFKIIATANTWGRGCTGSYNGNVMDPSTLTRFKAWAVDYDPAVDAAIVGNDTTGLLDFARAIRAALRSCFGDRADSMAVMSYRALRECSQDIKDGDSFVDALQQNFVQGLISDVDALNQIKRALAGSGPWFDAFNQICEIAATA